MGVFDSNQANKKYNNAIPNYDVDDGVDIVPCEENCLYRDESKKRCVFETCLLKQFPVSTPHHANMTKTCDCCRRQYIIEFNDNESPIIKLSTVCNDCNEKLYNLIRDKSTPKPTSEDIYAGSVDNLTEAQIKAIAYCMSSRVGKDEVAVKHRLSALLNLYEFTRYRHNDKSEYDFYNYIIKINVMDRNSALSKDQEVISWVTDVINGNRVIPLCVIYSIVQVNMTNISGCTDSKDLSTYVRDKTTYDIYGAIHCVFWDYVNTIVYGYTEESLEWMRNTKR